MTEYSSKHFGEMDLTNMENLYESEIDLGSKSIELTLNISKATKSIPKESIQNIDNYLTDIEKQEHNIRQLIQADYDKGGPAKNYVDDQIKAQEEKDILGLLNITDSKMDKRENVLSVIYLLRISFYPEKEDPLFAMYDYTIHEELTDDLLVVKLLKNDHIVVTIES